jgi:uncharacterized protein GlcG (DUF336 family)
MKRAIIPALLMAGNLSALAQAPASPNAPPVPAPTPLPKELPLSVAIAWAEAAIADCKSKGYNVTATYVNVNGDVKLVMRSDDTATRTVDIGRRKAYTVIKTGKSSGDYGASIGFGPGKPMPPNTPGRPPGAPPAPDADVNLIVFAGGLPIKMAGELIGAISISGAPGGEKDVACAEAGLAKVADKLK